MLAKHKKRCHTTINGSARWVAWHKFGTINHYNSQG